MVEGWDPMESRRFKNKQPVNDNEVGERRLGLSLPDERSLAMAFEGLRFTGNGTAPQMTSPHINDPRNEVAANIPVAGLDSPNSIYQQQYAPLYQQPFIYDTQTPSFMPSSYPAGLNMLHQNLEAERFYGSYQQQLQNYGTDQFQHGNHYNSGIGPSSGSNRQQFFERPANASSYCDYNTLPRGSYQYHPQSPQRRNSYPPDYLLDLQARERARKQYCPERILTKSHGMNYLRSLKSDSVVGDQLFANNLERVSTNAQNGSFRLDFEDPRSLLDLKFTSIDEVAGNILSLAKDQLGCRFLQRKFAEGHPRDVEKIFAEIIGHIAELMMDPFGNYLIQKLLDICSGEQRNQIVRAFAREPRMLIRVSCNMHGTRVVQKLIETLKAPEQISIFVNSLKHGIVALMKDNSGNHVTQCCMQYFPSKFNEFLYDAAIAHCMDLAVDRQACRVLQKCVEHSKGNQKVKLVTEICSLSRYLSQDAYGNYVVQFVLDQEIPWATAAIVEELKGSYEQLSTQKEGSNVVERCLQRASEDGRTKIVQELINSPRFGQIAQNQYGNYVVQSALERCKGALLSVLAEAIRPHIPALCHSPYGEKVVSSLKKFT